MEITKNKMFAPASRDSFTLPSNQHSSLKVTNDPKKETRNLNWNNIKATYKIIFMDDGVPKYFYIIRSKAQQPLKV